LLACGLDSAYGPPQTSFLFIIRQSPAPSQPIPIIFNLDVFATSTSPAPPVFNSLAR
jgi:hypothetical protein